MSKISDILKHKYGRYKVSPAEDRTFGGIVFDSKWESSVFQQLRQQVPEDHIHRQVAFTLQPKFKSADGKAVREIQYIADFVLSPKLPDPDVVINNDETIVMDAKGHVTDIFKLKNKMFMFKYSAVIQQVKKAGEVQAVIERYKKMMQ